MEKQTIVPEDTSETEKETPTSHDERGLFGLLKLIYCGFRLNSRNQCVKKSSDCHNKKHYTRLRDYDYDSCIIGKE